MTSMAVARRRLLAALLLVGLFLMHGLQTFCNDSSAGGHEMGRPAGGTAMAAPVAGHSESMRPMGSDRETDVSRASQSATTDGSMMLDLCVAILAAGALLAALRRRLPWPAQLAVKALGVRPEWTRLCRWPPGRTLSILCVMRT